MLNQIRPIGGLNLVLPSHLIGDTQCSVLQNVIARHGKAYSFPGTDRYNATALANPITWTERYYGINADKTFTKKTFCFSGLQQDFCL